MAFDMPKTGSWRVRGGWVVRQLSEDLDFTHEQAAGIVGNLGYESGQFKTLQEIDPEVPGSAGGYGWAQWTGPRRRAFQRWCAENHLTMSSSEANYGFVVHELRGACKRFAARLRKMTSIEAATRLTHAEYEAPRDALDGSYRSGPERLRLARQALEGAEGATDETTTEAVITKIDRVKAIQVILGVEPDGDFGPISNDALNALIADR